MKHSQAAEACHDHDLLSWAQPIFGRAPLLPVRIHGPKHVSQHVLPSRLGLATSSTLSVRAPCSRGQTSVRQTGAPIRSVLLKTSPWPSSHTVGCHQSWDGGGKVNCALGECVGHVCVFRRSQRPQLGHSNRSLLQHKGIKALLALGFPFLIYLRPPYNFQRDNTKATDLVSNTNSGWS